MTTCDHEFLDIIYTYESGFVTMAHCECFACEHQLDVEYNPESI